MAVVGVCTTGENCENGLGLWLGFGVCTPSENCENYENVFGFRLVYGVCTSVKMVKIVKIVKIVKMVWVYGCSGVYVPR